MKSGAARATVPEVSYVRQILIVEDEQPIREMIAFALRRAGFDVQRGRRQPQVRACSWPTSART